MPGVVYGNYNVATTGTNSVHGGSVRNNVFSLDGVNVNDPLVAYPGTDVNLETIEEVQVTTAGMSAEFGSASGAVFNVITKSGGNQLTGQLNGYFRNEDMQSSNVTRRTAGPGDPRGHQAYRGFGLGRFARRPRASRSALVLCELSADRREPGPLSTSLRRSWRIRTPRSERARPSCRTRNRIDGFYQYPAAIRRAVHSERKRAGSRRVAASTARVTTPSTSSGRAR